MIIRDYLLRQNRIRDAAIRIRHVQIDIGLARIELEELDRAKRQLSTLIIRMIVILSPMILYAIYMWNK